jgi:hypothetical protein
VLTPLPHLDSRLKDFTFGEVSADERREGFRGGWLGSCLTSVPRKGKVCSGFAGFRHLRAAGLVLGPGGNLDSFYCHAAPEEDTTENVSGSNLLPFGSGALTYMLS